MIIRKLSDNTKIYIDKYFAIVDEMEKNMRAVEVTDSISEMYINQMLAIHEGGIRMSENILSYTTNSNIETLAKSMIESSNKALTKLNDMLEHSRDCKNSERDVMLYQRRFLNILDNMISSMNKINVTNNLDIDFLSGMISHHEGGIAMAKNVLCYEICDSLKEFSENLITTHEMQINQMHQLLRMLG